MNAIIGVPPAFHRRSDLHVVERRWRTDANAVLRFTANVHSAVTKPGPEDVVFKLKVELQQGFTDELRRNMGAWWPSTGFVKPIR